ncbi:hypothetical protein V8F06_009489 [Rhypophila decipiens]
MLLWFPLPGCAYYFRFLDDMIRVNDRNNTLNPGPVTVFYNFGYEQKIQWETDLTLYKIFLCQALEDPWKRACKFMEEFYPSGSGINNETWKVSYHGLDTGWGHDFYFNATAPELLDEIVLSAVFRIEEDLIDETNAVPSITTTTGAVAPSETGNITASTTSLTTKSPTNLGETTRNDGTEVSAGGLGAAQIAGITVGAVAGLLLLVAIVWLAPRKRGLRIGVVVERRQQGEQSDTPPPENYIADARMMNYHRAGLGSEEGTKTLKRGSELAGKPIFGASGTERDSYGCESWYGQGQEHLSKASHGASGLTKSVEICLSACAFFEFTGDLQVSPNTGNNGNNGNNGNGLDPGPELIYDSGSRREFSWQSDLFSFNVSICQFGASRLSAGLCRLIAEVIDRDGPGTGVSSARWDVSNEGLFDDKDSGYYLNVTAEGGVETISRPFRIVTSDTTSPSSLLSSTATIITIPSSLLIVPPTLAAPASDKTSTGTANQSSSSTNSSSSNRDTGAKTNTLNTGQIAGIAIGAVVVVFVMILAGWFIMQQRGLTIAIIPQADRTKSAKHQMQDWGQVGFTSERGHLKGGSEIAGTPICEADGDMKDVTVRHELCDDR